MKYILETERLKLREFVTDDAKFIVKLLNSPGWLKFIGDRSIRTEEEAIVYLENGPMKSYRENGFGLCLVETKEGKRKIGMCGILKRDTLEHPDIGFAFLPEYTGKGYAYEIAAETINFAKDKLKLQTIYAITVFNNSRSIRLLEKIGLHFSKIILFDNEELLLYSNF